MNANSAALLATIARVSARRAKRPSREAVAAKRLAEIAAMPADLRHFWEGSVSASIDADVADGLTVDI